MSGRRLRYAVGEQAKLHHLRIFSPESQHGSRRWEEIEPGTEAVDLALSLQ